MQIQYFSINLDNETMQTITLQLPDELVTLAGINKDKLSQETLQLVVLELYREELISLGKAAELCNLSIEAFMAFSASREVALHYGEAELENDREFFAGKK
jgi:predicted HTH domain antitoxin